MSAFPDPSAPTVRPLTAAPDLPTTPAADGRRRLLVGTLVVRRVSSRSVARVAFPVLGVSYAVAMAVGAVAWNVAALAGWEPSNADLEGPVVFWVALVAGLIAVPLTVLVLVAMTGLYNVVSDRRTGIEIAVVSPRWRRGRDPR